MPDVRGILAVRRFLIALRLASGRDREAAIYAFFSPELDAPMLLDADARAIHDALVDLAQYGVGEESFHADR